MDFIEAYGWGGVAFVLMMYLFGGFIKGLVGFALPIIAVVGSASVLDKELAVAMIIIPVLIANLMQAFREGVGPLVETARRFGALNVLLGFMIVAGAFALQGVDDRLFFALIGVVTLLTSVIQLLGWRPSIPQRMELGVGLAAGGVGGFLGGLSGIWGPPVILFLNALDLSKREHMRATGLAFLVGGIVLLPAHLATGILNAQTLPISLALVAPAMLGVYLGRIAEARLDAQAFRKVTLIVLVLASLNLLRRAFLG